MKRKGVLVIVLLMGVVAALEVGHSSAVQCIMPEEYSFGTITGIGILEAVKTDSWFTVTLRAVNNGRCRTLYRSYAELPADLTPRWSFPDYFWLEPGESTTVEMEMWTR